MPADFPGCSRRNVRGHFFPVDVRSHRAATIVPVFLPFSGCPCRCVYCAQDRQTGTGCSPVADVLEGVLRRLDAVPSSGDRELAFYGGTFTSLDDRDRQECLALLDSLLARGEIRCARCSTRPDALSAAMLDELLRHGLSLIELGVQSFDDGVLALSRRGYGRKTAIRGCGEVLEAGFELGVQLLPGMPGSTPEIFLRDVDTALSLCPSCLRFYPCLVPEGTVLAAWYREGRYCPWPLDETVDALAQALTLAWAADVPVIRLAVAPEAVFDASLLAGPRHPALGSMIQAEALLRTVKGLLREHGGHAVRLELPARCQGFLYGNRGCLRPHWEALGLNRENISFVAVEQGRLWTTF